MMIIDMLYCFLMDYRCMDFEITCESASNINRLSPSLAGFVYFDNLESLFQSLIRRSLVYPLFRNYDLAIQVKKDLENILVFGSNRMIIMILIKIYKLFDQSSPRYLLNTIFLKDLIIFTQNLSEEEISELLTNIKSLESTKELAKEKLGMHIEKLEKHALDSMAEDEIEENQAGVQDVE